VIWIGVAIWVAMVVAVVWMLARAVDIGRGDRE